MPRATKKMIGERRLEAATKRQAARMAETRAVIDVMSVIHHLPAKTQIRVLEGVLAGLKAEAKKGKGRGTQD